MKGRFYHRLSNLIYGSILCTCALLGWTWFKENESLWSSFIFKKSRHYGAILVLIVVYYRPTWIKRIILLLLSSSSDRSFIAQHLYLCLVNKLLKFQCKVEVPEYKTTLTLVSSYSLNAIRVIVGCVMPFCYYFLFQVVNCRGCNIVTTVDNFILNQAVKVRTLLNRGSIIKGQQTRQRLSVKHKQLLFNYYHFFTIFFQSCRSLFTFSPELCV